jgi:hypothetical protein
MTFQEELERLINRHSAEGSSNTPDFILAKYLSDCLQAFSRAVIHRERWYGFEMRPGMPETIHRSSGDNGSGDSLG